MAQVTEEQRAHYGRSVTRAKALLRRGDKVRLTICGGGEATYVFDCWDGEWMISKSGIDELHPYNVVRLNGKPLSFRDEHHRVVSAMILERKAEAAHVEA
ncbi:hypothetical protein KIKIMORA_02800 [Brevundimonas phage vB_BpoS-Kikimora]|uniref:Uncharacterized protein n=1 Tax=Brevundimonas phage vB_BpoS-Kikimora TaxID=2948601 RepID=A0A9E7MTM1_9CAUD|nr:hypothetical protein KIKIMORA_02800 [Brevundimonas phage vB_BpoS-Kikimora]